MQCFCGHVHDNRGSCSRANCGCRRERDPILNGQTVRHAASKAHLSPSMLSRYLNLERKLSIAAHARLAQAVGITALELYERMLERAAR